MRGGARRRRAGLPQLQPRRRVLRTGTIRRQRPAVRRRAGRRDPGDGRPARGLRDRPPHCHGLVYVPDDRASSTSHDAQCRWPTTAASSRIPLRAGKIYMRPVGLQGAAGEAPPAARWRLIGTVAEGTFCHKPCTVSGGGKSEISKAIADAMIYGPIFVADFDAGHRRRSRQIFDRDYSDRFREARRGAAPTRRADPVARAIARQRDQAADPVAPTTPTSTTPGWRHSATHHATGLHHQALLPARMGRRVARALQRRHRQRRPGQRAEGDRPQAASATTCGSGFDPDGGWRTFKLRQDFDPGGEGADGGRHHRVRRRARPT